MATALGSPAHGMSARLRYVPIGIAASVIQALMMIPGYHEDGDFDQGAWTSMLVASLVLSVIVFTLFVPNGGARTALVLGILSILATVAFWMMFSLPLAAASGVVGLRTTQYGTRARMASVGIGLAAFAAVATIAITVTDAIVGL